MNRCLCKGKVGEEGKGGGGREGGGMSGRGEGVGLSTLPVHGFGKVATDPVIGDRTASTKQLHTFKVISQD